jgi:hypothetical protein
MAIKTGIGVGAAQVFDTSGIMNTYARQIAQQQKIQAAQAQREFLSAEKEKERAERAAAKFDEDIADIMASAKLGGIRDRDVEEITKAYNEVKDFYSKSGSLKDSEKPLFRAELRNRMNTINDAAVNSIELSKRYYSLASKVAENPWDYDSKVIQDLDYINKTPLSKLGALANMDPITYQKVPNVKLLDNIMGDVNKLGEINAQYSKEEKIGSDKYKDVSIVDKAYIQKNLIQGVMNSPEAFSSVKRIFASENPGQQPTDQALTEFLTKKYEEKYPYIYKSDIKKQPKEPKPEKETNDDAYVGYLKGAFSKNRTSSIQNLNAIAGNNAKIKEVKDGLQVTYKPIITMSAGGVPMIIENPLEETRIAKNAGELASILRSANVTGAGAKVISSVGGAYSGVKSR